MSMIGVMKAMFGAHKLAGPLVNGRGGGHDPVLAAKVAALRLQILAGRTPVGHHQQIASIPLG
jgi:hypothetical protein